MAKDRAANQIFVGYPWKTYKSHWENTLNELHKRSPLYFVAIGRKPGQPAAQLLNSILRTIDRSSYAFFDASAGNPNVALEYGYARATIDEESIYSGTRTLRPQAAPAHQSSLTWQAQLQIITH